MKVSELIEILKTQPQNATVVVCDEGESVAWLMQNDSIVLSDVTNLDREYFHSLDAEATQIVRIY
jgi:hypothetical protein